MAECAQPECCEVLTVGEISMAGDGAGRVCLSVLLVLFLGWCFLGVAIISDIFMAAIEKITSQKKRTWDSKRNRYKTVTVWNPAVANLTLMALGSSAPEILLNVIGIIKDDFQVQPLGPSTIVGSAAFNLLVITGVCVIAIPDGQVRYINEYGTYICTVFFSLFAYAWLLIIIEFDGLGFKKNEVTVWEASLTLLLEPILVTCAYVLNIGYFSGEKKKPSILAAEMTKEELAELECKVRKDHGSDLTEEQTAKFINIECAQPWSRAKYRVSATRALTKGRPVRQGMVNRTLSSIGGLVSKKVHPIDEEETSKDDALKAAAGVFISFVTPRYAVLESAGTILLELRRTGDLTGTVQVGYSTRDGTAKEHTDYRAVSGTIVFKPGEDKQCLSIEIVNDSAFEEDEDFYVDLKNPTGLGSSVAMGDYATTTVTIIDDDLPGVIKFQEDSIDVNEGMDDREVAIRVVRVKGSSGDVTCKFRTEDGTAKAGLDYEAAEGEVEFREGETETFIKVAVRGKGRYLQTEMFRVILEGPITGGAKFCEDADGAKDGTCVLSVLIKSEKEAQQRVDKLMNSLASSWEKAKLGNSNWRDQFRDALLLNGGDEDDEEAGSPTCLDIFMHVINVPWKLVFALCPPTDYYGGWVCFICSLFFIGGMTLILGDAAELLGCFVDLPESVVAITLVAMGTSLPDTFASKNAAMNDPYADASIVNVTGSNSVNVFLGIGIPWLMGSVYHQVKSGTDLQVPSGDLTSSVIIFSCCAVVCLCLLQFRRTFLGGELGGPRGPKIATTVFLVLLWFGYVGVASYFAIQKKNETMAAR